jgi:hypothetical protein
MEPRKEFRELEQRLRNARPEPPAYLLDDLVARLDAPPSRVRRERPRRFRLGLAGALAAAALFAFAAVGGLGYARTAIGDSVTGAAGAVADAVAPKQQDVEARRALAATARGSVPAGITAGTQSVSQTGTQPGAQTSTGGGGGGGPSWFTALNPGHWFIPGGDNQYGTRVAICVTKRTPVGTIRVTLYVHQATVPWWLARGATLGPCRR